MMTPPLMATTKKVQKVLARQEELAVNLYMLILSQGRGRRARVVVALGLKRSDNGHTPLEPGARRSLMKWGFNPTSVYQWTNGVSKRVSRKDAPQRESSRHVSASNVCGSAE